MSNSAKEEEISIALFSTSVHFGRHASLSFLYKYNLGFFFSFQQVFIRRRWDLTNQTCDEGRHELHIWWEKGRVSTPVSSLGVINHTLWAFNTSQRASARLHDEERQGEARGVMWHKNDMDLSWKWVSEKKLDASDECTNQRKARSLLMCVKRVAISQLTKQTTNKIQVLTVFSDVSHFLIKSLPKSVSAKFLCFQVTCE